MAKSDINLSKTHILYGQRGVSSHAHQVRRHTHPHWQLELILTGQAELDTGGTITSIVNGQFLLIPPGQLHGFRYTDRTEFCSIKFHWTGGALPLTLFPMDSVAQHLAGVCEALVKPGFAEDDRCRHTVAAALDCLLSWRVHEQHDVVPEDDLVAQVQAYVQTHGHRPIRVRDLASVLQMSTGHLSAAFRKQTGLTLKVWLDSQLSDRACRCLRGTDQPIAVVAETFGFIDIYQFSRFIRRVSGKPPSHWRALDPE